MSVKQAASLKEHCGPLSCQLRLRAKLVEAQLFSGGGLVQFSKQRHWLAIPDARMGWGWGFAVLSGTQNGPTPERHAGRGAFLAWRFLRDVNRTQRVTPSAQGARMRLCPLQFSQSVRICSIHTMHSEKHADNNNTHTICTQLFVPWGERGLESPFFYHYERY